MTQRSFVSRLGKILDVSYTGVKLLTISCKLGVGDKARLRITIPELDIDVRRDAYVSWIGRRGDSAWHTGFAFCEPLDQGIFELLEERRYVERRRGMRYPVSTSASIRPKGGEHDSDVSMQDFSSTGCRIETLCTLCVSRLGGARRRML